MWKRTVVRIVTLVIVMAALALTCASIAYASNTATFSVTATGDISVVGPPSNLTLTDLGLTTVQADWVASGNATYYMIRGSRTAYPTDPTEGELLGYITAVSHNFTAADLSVNTNYVSLWAYLSDNVTHSGYITASIGGDPMENTATNIGLLALVILPLALTYAMFHSRNSLLGFPSAIFWAILGAFAYSQSTTPWGDWQYFLFFSSMGMCIFSMYAAYALRKRDLEPKQPDWDDYDEYSVARSAKRKQGGNGHDDTSDLSADIEFEETPSRRVREIRDRASRRRSGGVKQPVRWGEFK